MTSDAGLPRLSPVLDALRQHYPGPCLIYDLVALRETAEALAQIGRRTGVRFIAAAKALPLPALLDMASHLGHGFDVSNVGELRRLRDWCRADGGHRRLAYASMTGPALMSSPGATEPYVDCLSVNVETPAQLAEIDNLRPWAGDLDIGARILAQPSAADGAPAPMSRFGISAQDTEQLAAIAAHPRFAALHCHIEGDARSPGSHVATARHLIQVAHGLPARPRRLNLGGGFRRESIAEIERICRDVRAVVPADMEIMFEPGAWLTMHAGYALARLLGMHDRPDLAATLATLDLSRECHLRWDLPQLLRWWAAPPLRDTVMLFGPTCSEADHLGTFRYQAPRTVPVADADGLLLFGGISGYAAAFNLAFNGINPARVLTVGNTGRL